MLIIYGVLVIVSENYNKRRRPRINKLSELTFKTALFIGIFQVLSLIPGTSRSGATIIGAILVGTSRQLAAEYTFFLAIPVMFGASLLKLVKFGFHFTGTEVAILLVGMLTAFFVSIMAGGTATAVYGRIQAERRSEKCIWQTEYRNFERKKGFPRRNLPMRWGYRGRPSPNGKAARACLIWIKSSE